MLFLIIVNAIISFGAVVVSFIALTRPGKLSGSTDVNAGEWFYAKMYAARAIPLGVIAGVLPFFAEPGAWPIRVVLIAAALVQVADALIGFGKREWGMIGAPSAAFVVHALTAAFL